MIHISVSERSRAVDYLGIEDPAKHASGDFHTSSGLAGLWRILWRANLHAPSRSPKTNLVAILADIDFLLAINSMGKEMIDVVHRT